MEHIKQEYPSYGHGDMRCPAYDILQADGSRITELSMNPIVSVKESPPLRAACHLCGTGARLPPGDNPEGCVDKDKLILTYDL